MPSNIDEFGSLTFRRSEPRPSLYRKRFIFILSLAALVLVIGMGFWLGAFAWFGGYTRVKSGVGWLALVLVLGVTALRVCMFPRRWPLHVAYAVSSQVIYVLAVAAGQVWYFDPSGSAEALRLFKLAVQGGL